jgi:hypothetical protein
MGLLRPRKCRIEFIREQFFAGARPPALVDRNESHGGRVCRPEVMGETTLSRLNCKRSFRCSVF